MTKELLKTAAQDWISQFDIPAPPEYWSISITLSTVSMDHWFYKRNKLKSEDIKLSLTIPEQGLWVAQLDRYDNIFQVQWRPGNDLRIVSQQLKYKRLIAWPQLTSLSEFPLLIPRIEECLGVKFMHHVNIGARMLDSNELSCNPQLRNWLAPYSTAINSFWRA